MQQLGLKSIKRNFRFLNYYWGKAIFCAFIACASLSNSQNQMLQYVNAFLFFGLTAGMIVLAIIDRASDREKSEQDEEDAKQWKEQLEFEENPALYYIKQKGKDVQAAYNNMSQTASGMYNLNKQFNNNGGAADRSQIHSKKRFQEFDESRYYEGGANESSYLGGNWRDEASFPQGATPGDNSRYGGTFGGRRHNF